MLLRNDMSTLAEDACEDAALPPLAAFTSLSS